MRFSKRNTFTKKKNIDLKIKYNQKISLKPVGLWYSYYGAWYNWALDEMPKMLYKYNHKLIIKKEYLITIREKDSNKILLLDNKKDISIFTKKYGIYKNGECFYINWCLVSEDYGGIEFNPYLLDSCKKSIELDFLWYNTIDVSSGCIWNLHPIISNTELVYKKDKNEYIRV
jgi:hypothetical protein